MSQNEIIKGTYYFARNQNPELYELLLKIPKGARSIIIRDALEVYYKEELAPEQEPEPEAEPEPEITVEAAAVLTPDPPASSPIDTLLKGLKKNEN